ncbi:hypothetical protein [Dyella telluris]|uniref:Phage tail protein n=1 Tax=Dyella telluris TaxID=2763498 RepID=A0A7G8Q4F3_9GAMM|nr:hypothetical protein [Dyella telluris]QNK01661.1 hypothetical protein H8F01_00325 [Dyella telluris]
MATIRWEDRVTAFAEREDRKYYSVTVEDPSKSTEFEGGYVASRPRHARKQLRRTISTGFTDLSPSDADALQTLWNDVRGGSLIFIYLDKHKYEAALWNAQKTNPKATVDKAPYRMYVRFKSGEQMKFTPVGFGSNLRWDVQGITLEEV